MARGGGGRSGSRGGARGGGRGKKRRGGIGRWIAAAAALVALAGAGALAAAWMGLVPGVRWRDRSTRADTLAVAPPPDTLPTGDSAIAAAADGAPPDSAAGDPMMDDALPILASDSAAGDALYRGVGRCAGCHGAAGEGVEGLGPNLRDESWLHGGTRREIRAVVAAGASPARGSFSVMMPAYGGQLDAAQLAQLTAYVWTLSRPGTVVPDTAFALPPATPPAAPPSP
jgi:mono/diheme cytochrome c family protein